MIGTARFHTFFDHQIILSSIKMSYQFDIEKNCKKDSPYFLDEKCEQIMINIKYEILTQFGIVIINHQLLII